MATILIIDDEAVFRRVTRAMLAHLGHTAVELADAKSAAAVYDAVRPDLVLLDMLMPEQDGIETLRALREVDPAARIIAVSGGGLIDPEIYLQAARRFRADHNLAKPFTVAQLAAAVATVLPGAPEPDQSADDPCGALGAG